MAQPFGLQGQARLLHLPCASEARRPQEAGCQGMMRKRMAGLACKRQRLKCQRLVMFARCCYEDFLPGYRVRQAGEPGHQQVEGSRSITSFCPACLRLRSLLTPLLSQLLSRILAQVWGRMLCKTFRSAMLSPLDLESAGESSNQAVRNLRNIAEERVGRKCGSLRVLNSYWASCQQPDGSDLHVVMLRRHLE